jgi:lipopolysaccharide export system protein LptC
MFTASETRYFQISRRGPTSSDYAELSKPELTLFGEDAPPWHIVAEEGKAEDQGDRILLWGKVRIWQTDQDKLSEFTTPFLIVEPERQYAETDKPVMITSAGSTTQAVGMKAYLKEDRIQLLSRVRGTHEPH